MGISAEQYRSKIGSHDNFLERKDALSRFKDRYKDSSMELTFVTFIVC